tara:strand:+ start:341 stop:526 length:186 start_codon:yes stop_codon:yes gene_type:complete
MLYLSAIIASYCLAWMFINLWIQGVQIAFLGKPEKKNYFPYVLGWAVGFGYFLTEFLFPAT